jgi:hypothetical protein
MWSRRRRRTTLAVVLTVLIALALGGASPALAQSAEVEKISECSEQDGAVFCTESLVVLQGVVTPSGQASIVQHIRFDNSFTAPECSSRDVGDSRVHLLIDDEGQNQEFHFAFQGRSTFTCAGLPSRDCITDLHFHFANGVIQFTREETVCT